MTSDLNQNPWDAGIRPDPEVVRRAISLSFLELDIRSIRFLKDGWDSCAFEVNDDLIFRFPKRAEVERQLQAEREVLRAFGPVAPVPVPKFEFAGERTSEFPFEFVGYRKLLGVSQLDARISFNGQLYQQLASFLRSLHALPVDGFFHVHADDALTEESWEAHRIEMTRILTEVLSDKDELWVIRELERFSQKVDWSVLSKPHGVCLVHNDLLPEHILIDPKTHRISGIIDWGDVAVGSPAADYAGIGYSFGLEPMTRLISELDGADSQALRSRSDLGIVLCGLDDLWFGYERNEPPRIRLAAARLREVFQA